MKKHATLFTLFGLGMVVCVSLSFTSYLPNRLSGSSGEGLCSGYCFADSIVHLSEDHGWDVAINPSFTCTLMGNAEPLWVSVDGNGILCPGGLANHLTAFANGGTPPYTYLWSNGMTEEVLYDLPAGEYSVTVTDAAGATAVGSMTIEQPDPFIIYEASVIPFTCIAPAIVTVGASGGKPNYKFEWSNGVTGPTSTISPGELPVTITATDRYNCTSEPYIISDLPYDTAAPIIMAKGGVLTCKAPEINLSSEGSDIGPCITYFWEGPEGYLAYEANPPVNQPGEYTLTISNVCNGCMASAKAEITEDKSIPVITVDVPVDTFSCGVPVLELNACFSAGSGFSWKTAYGMIVYGADSCVLGVALPGVYTLSLSNPDEGCTATLDVTIGGIGSPLLRIDSMLNATCHGSQDGYAAIAVIGGLSPYTILWPDSSDLSVRSDLGAGSYVITLTDDAGCQSSPTVTIQQPDPILLNLQVNHESAPGAKDGAVTVNPQDGIPPYLILWSTGDTTYNIAGLAPGTYDVTVTDSIGCSVTQSFPVTPFECTLSVNAKLTSVACHGDKTGSIELTIINPTGSYSILWSNGGNGEMLDSLGADFYTVEVTDSVGCVATDSFEITAPPPIMITLDSLTEESASGASDGALFISVTGGEGNYTYEWRNDKGILVSNQKNIVDITEGLYEICVTDENGCEQCQELTMLINAISPLWHDKVRVYPNPTNGILYLPVTATAYQYGMTDLYGRHIPLVQEGQQLRIGEAAPGVYMLYCYDRNGAKGHQLILLLR